MKRRTGAYAIIELTEQNDAGADGSVCRPGGAARTGAERPNRREFAMTNLSRRDAIRLVVVIATALFATSVPSVATERMPLAIDGYDPVAYFTIGSPTRGLPEIEYEWDEHLYRFSRPEHREIFKADPVRYAPQFGNFCAMALTRGELVEANPEYWLISEGKLYLFGKAVGPTLFQQDLAGNIIKADQNRWLIQNQTALAPTR